jgi:lysophosphatidylglycerol acyltransferase 1
MSNFRPCFADRVMWVMDRVFKFSNFGAVSWMHDDFFILAVKLQFC